LPSGESCESGREFNLLGEIYPEDKS